MATGIFVKVNPDVVNMQHLVSFDSGDDALGKAAWVLIGFGVFVLIVSAFGFFTACCGESKRVFVIIVSMRLKVSVVNAHLHEPFLSI